MCGIVGYTGKKEVIPILFEGLKRLEYRGYDSAGFAVPFKGSFVVRKQSGKVADLERMAQEAGNTDAKTGIGHTRWATHGRPTEANAHPHLDCTGRIALVHNGIIENHKELRTHLVGRGHTFRSETDTEVVAHLLEEFLRDSGVGFLEGFRKTLQVIEGSYALAVLDLNEPEAIYAAHLSSPLVIGKGNGENFLASDTSPFFGRTDEIIDLPEKEIAVITPHSVKIFSVGGSTRDPKIEKIRGAAQVIQKGDFPHFMLKEIFEQPERIKDAMRGRLIPEEGVVRLGGLEKIWDKITCARRIIIVGCGTSWHAGLAGRYMLEEMARIPVEVEYASEFRYRHPIIYKDDVVIAISQSGETADTLSALREAKQKGATVAGIVNVPGSAIARETGAGVYTHAGQEIGVASTKAFTSELTVLALLTFALAKARGKISHEVEQKMLKELSALPEKVEEALHMSGEVKKIASVLKDSSNFLYLGRGANFPTALEGALKLKEISYIHAEGYPAAEMKHGPIALIDEKMPVVFLVPQDGIYEKVISNIEEVRARGGRIIAVANTDDAKIGALAEFVIRVPRELGWLSPIVNIIPLQLLAYYIALERGLPIDQPRNLAKSVTVE